VPQEGAERDPPHPVKYHWPKRGKTNGSKRAKTNGPKRGKAPLEKKGKKRHVLAQRPARTLEVRKCGGSTGDMQLFFLCVDKFVIFG